MLIKLHVKLIKFYIYAYIKFCLKFYAVCHDRGDQLSQGGDPWRDERRVKQISLYIHNWKDNAKRGALLRNLSSRETGLMAVGA